MTLKSLFALAWALIFSALAHAERPALVVVIVIDGLPHEQVMKYRDLYGPGGFRRLLEEGAWYGNARHGHAVTATAPGHATMLTGTYPYRHGIIDNEWIDRNTLAEIYCTGDPAHGYIGHETKKLDGTSPANLRASTVGDELKYANNGRSKVLAVAGKDRGAILLAGKRGTAYMYMSGSGRFASSTFYLKEHPAWHAEYYAKNPQDKWLGQTWGLLLPETAYARSIPEGQAWQRAYVGSAKTFPFPLPKEAKAYYSQLIRTPFADEATLDFARAAIEGEDLGRNPAGVPDLLGISLSTHDYVNHSFGPESRISQDHLLRVDRALAGFFDSLERRFGLDRVLIVLSADHGFANAPEFSAATGVGGARLSASRMMAELNAALAARFGVKGNLAVRQSHPTIILDRQLIEKNSLNRGEVEAAAQRILLGMPGVAQAYTRSQLEIGALPDLPASRMVLRAWNRELSGDLYVLLQPNVIASSAAATHGSAYNYDSSVPLMLYGKAWIKPGKYPQAAYIADLAPTLAYLLDIRAPSASEGRVLAEILK